MIRVAAKLSILFVLISAGVYLGYRHLGKMLLAGPGQQVKRVEQQKTSQNSTALVSSRRNSGEPDFQIIVRRNIFQASLSATEVEENVIEEVAPTTLDLTLLGTVSGNERDARAIIVDNTSKQQEIYQIGDSVQGALIESISRGKVTLNVHGKNEALFLKDREGGGPAAPVPPSADSWKPERNDLEKNIQKKNPRVRPHRRISFRLDLEQEGIKSGIVEEKPGRRETEQHRDSSAGGETHGESSGGFQSKP